MKWLILIVGVGYGIARGAGFILSDGFQKYGDEKKAPWTCQVNNVIGQLYTIMSEYDRAKYFFDHTLTRCPDTSMAELALFKVAYCIEGNGDVRRAAAAYKEYAAKYPGTKRARLALRSSEVLVGM